MDQGISRPIPTIVAALGRGYEERPLEQDQEDVSLAGVVSPAPHQLHAVDVAAGEHGDGEESHEEPEGGEDRHGGGEGGDHTAQEQPYGLEVGGMLTIYNLKLLPVLSQGTARYAGQLLDPAEGFGLWPKLFVLYKQRNRPFL